MGCGVLSQQQKETLTRTLICTWSVLRCGFWYLWKEVQKVSHDLLCPVPNPSHDSLPSSLQMLVQQLWIHLSVQQTGVHVGAAGCTQDESPCFPAAHVLVGRAYKDVPGSSGYCEGKDSGGGTRGSELVVKYEWKEEPVHTECSGTSNLQWKRVCGRKVWHEMTREGHSLGLRSLKDMDCGQNVCKDFFF